MDQPVYAEAVYVDGLGVSQNLSSRNHSARNISARTLSPTTSISSKDAASTKEFLNNNNWPRGLQNYIIQNSQKIAYRYFILDDSGSMASNDGKRLLRLSGPNNFKIVSCTRWTELGESMKFHTTLASALNVSCEFRMLNSMTPVNIGGPDGHPEGLAIVHSVLNDSPGGQTPLCRHISEVINKVRSIESELRRTGQKACIIIATDGESSDGDLAKAMAPLQHLPVWVVIKLCTDDERVVEYWNGIDSKLEVDIDVLDDMSGESSEVYEVNPWLNYCEPIHRMREFGVLLREMDLLDERLLSADQARIVCSILFDIPLTELPHPEADFEGLIRRIDALNRDYGKYYSLHYKRMLPLIDIASFRKCYGPASSCIVS